MNLLKQNIITISIGQRQLSQNFYLIEQEIKRITSDIINLKHNSQIIIQRINEIDPDQSMQYVQQHYPKNQLSLLTNPNNIDSKEKDANPNRLSQDHSVELLNSGNEYLGIFGDEQKVWKEDKKKVKEASQIQLGKRSKKNEKEKKQSKCSDIILKELIKDLQNRLSEMEKIKQKDEERIENIEKDNQRIRKVLGFKGQKSKQKNKQQKKKESQFPNIDLFNQQNQNSERVITSSNGSNKAGEEQKMELMVQQNNFMACLSKSFEQLKQYVKSKMRIVQSSLQRFGNEIGKSKIQVNELRVKVDENDYKLTKLKEYEKQNLQIIGRSRTGTNEQKLKPSISIYNKTKTSTSQGHILNDTVQSYKNYYQDKIVQIFEEMDKIRTQYYNMVEKLTNQGEIGNDHQKLKDLAIKISSIKSPNQQKIKKQLNSLKREHKKLRDQFNLLIGDVNVGNNQTRTFIIKPNENKQDWKDVTQKIFKLKQELLSYVKDLENKISLNNDMTIVIQELQVAISQCKILIGKKVNITDFQKYNKRIQNRLNNFIRQMCQKEGIINQQQALIAKQPWFCLSCDSQIKNYTAKVGRPICNQRMGGKKVNPQLHMVRRPQQSKLPSVH